MVRRAVKAELENDWWKLVGNEALNTRLTVKLKESYCQARQEDAQCKSIVQKVMQRSTDFFKGNHRASSGAGRRQSLVRVPSLPPFPA